MDVLRSTAAEPSRPILRDIQRITWAADVPIGDTTIGAAAGDALQFRIEGAGRPSSRALVPQSDAAARLLDGPRGAALEQALRGMLATVDPHASRSDLEGISLSRDPVDYQANLAVNMLEREAPRILDHPDADVGRATITGAIQAAQISANATLANTQGWLNLGPLASSQLVRLAGTSDPRDARIGTWIAQLGAHEPLHTVTPVSTDEVVHERFRREPRTEDEARAIMDEVARDPHVTTKPLNWLEEASVDTMTTWAGNVAEVGRRMGIPVLEEIPEQEPLPPQVEQARNAALARPRGTPLESSERATLEAFVRERFGVDDVAESDLVNLSYLAHDTRLYRVHTAGMHRLLRMAGLDPADPADAPAAATLLQDTRLTYVPGRIADLIIEANELSPTIREPLRRRIRDAGADVPHDPLTLLARIDAIERWLESQRAATTTTGRSAPAPNAST